MGNRDSKPPANRESVKEIPEPSERRLIRTVANTMKNRLPDGVELMLSLENGKVMKLHETVRQTFSPNACAKAEELTAYLWSVGRPVSLEPGGGITIRGRGSSEKYIIGRAFYREAEIEYRMIHAFIAKLLG
ncbi:MAG: hypothetical protein ABIC40_01740 [bacterium]